MAAKPAAKPPSLNAVSDTFATLASHQEAFDRLVQQLVEQNQKLQADLLEAQRQLARLAGEDDPELEDDDRSFGTHLREAWTILRGK